MVCPIKPSLISSFTDAKSQCTHTVEIYYIRDKVAGSYNKEDKLVGSLMAKLILPVTATKEEREIMYWTRVVNGSPGIYNHEQAIGASTMGVVEFFFCEEGFFEECIDEHSKI